MSVFDCQCFGLCFFLSVNYIKISVRLVIYDNDAQS